VLKALLNEGSLRNPRIAKLRKVLESAGVRVGTGERGRLIDLAGTREHQGVILKVEPYPYVPFADMLGAPRLLLIDNIEDPHNVGAIMRSAEAFSFSAVLLPRRGVPLVLPSVVKASAGACEHLRVACNCSANQYVKVAAAEGYTIAALDRKGNVSLAQLRSQSPERLLLAVGGENRGVGQFILNRADSVVSIRQTGRVDSLNASVAAAIALHALSRGPVDA
jgi:23S rRNA (guanosine2251-2'-O)-methyltransferase